MSGLWYFDCDQCGHIGRLETLKDHPTRPMPDDLGFCPECGAGQRDVYDREAIIDVLNDYDEDGPAYVAKLDAAVPA